MNLTLKYYLNIYLPLALLLAGGVLVCGEPANTGAAVLRSSSCLSKPVWKTTAPLPWQGLNREVREKKTWDLARELAKTNGLDAALIMAVVRVESNFRPWAVSKRGAMGLMQINRVTAEHLGLATPLDPKANLTAGVRYLAQLMARFDYDLRLALAAYNAGPTRVGELGSVPKIEETRQFVDRVLKARDHFRVKYQALASK